MRKLVLVFAICITVLGSSALWANASLLVKGGLELSGEHSITTRLSSHVYDVDSSTALGFELMASSNDALGFGIGAIFQSNRSLPLDEEDDPSKESFNNLPLYGIIHFSFPLKPNLKIGALANLGINYLDGNKNYLKRYDLKVGSYYAFGAFLEFNKSIYSELVYRECNASYELNTVSKYTVKINTSNVSIMFGYRFTIPIS